MNMTVRFNPQHRAAQKNNGVNNSQRQQMGFGNILLKGNHTELKLEQVVKLVRGNFPEDVKQGLEKLLNNNKRVIKYMYEPSAIHPHQLVLGRPGLNESSNPNRSWVYKKNSSSEANGSGTTILEGLNDLIKTCNEGTLSD